MHHLHFALFYVWYIQNVAAWRRCSNVLKLYRFVLYSVYIRQTVTVLVENKISFCIISVMTSSLLMFVTKTRYKQEGMHDKWDLYFKRKFSTALSENQQRYDKVEQLSRLLHATTKNFRIKPTICDRKKLNLNMHMDCVLPQLCHTVSSFNAVRYHRDGRHTAVLFHKPLGSILS